MFHGENLALKAGKNEITFQADEGDNGEVTINYAAVAKASTGIRGLTASYFDDQDLKELKVTRIDPEISFNWGEGSPDPLIDNQTFSARWEGTIEPLYSETYTFYSKSDNGRRLWIDGKPVLNKWDETHDETATGEIKLEKGKKYAINYEYFEVGGGANTRLEWSSKSQVRETVAFGEVEAARGEVGRPVRCKQKTRREKLSGFRFPNSHRRSTTNPWGSISFR